MDKRREAIAIAVHARGGAYEAGAVSKRASSTSSARAAAERLGEKVFGATSFTGASLLPALATDDHTVTRFKLSAMTVTAWCWQTGLIEIGVNQPEGALEVATGLQTDLELALAVMAREGQGASKGKLLVPGVPEAAEDSPEQVDALIEWLRLCAGRKGLKRLGFGTVRFVEPGEEAVHG